MLTIARSQLRSLLTAVMFLTRVPVPADLGHGDEQLARSTIWFPVVGAMVGLVGAAVFHIGVWLWLPTVAVALSMAATVWMTGAFHEDGLADVCDGFGAEWTREQILENLKDSRLKDRRLGTYGAVGLALALLIKWSTLVSLGPAQIGPALVVGHTLGRFSSLLLIWRYPYVRSEGKARPFAASVTGPRLAFAVALTLVIAVLAVGWSSLAVITAMLTVTVSSGLYFQRRIGGMTGNCLGATNQGVELAVYLTLAGIVG